MTQIFHPGMNTVARLSIFGALFILAGVLWFSLILKRSPYSTEENVARAQPVPFSHKHHVKELGLDCRFCHLTVEDSAVAGIPPTEVCMTCHSQVFSDSPMLEPVRASFRTGEPIAWTRVHDLPDFVYFDHSIHLSKGVGCSNCHGAVDEMPLTWKESSLHMEWCLDCHRNPKPHLRPRDKVFDMRWSPEDAPESMPDDLIRAYHVQSLTDCSICHR